MYAAAWDLISFMADALATLQRFIEAVIALPLRFCRLASLRSCCDGVVPVTTQFDGPAETNGRVRLRCGPYCRIGRRVYFETHGGAQIQLGAHVWLNTGCMLVAYSAIQIGDHTLIGEYVTLRDANHGLALGVLIQEQAHETAPIHVGRDVWIGRGAVLLPGVTIGDGAVIGANAVVTRDVRAGAIVAGVPAKLLRMRSDVRVVTQ